MADSYDTQSVDTSFDNQDDLLLDRTDDEILQLLEDTKKYIDENESELQIFERYYKRIEPNMNSSFESQQNVSTTPSQSIHDLSGTGSQVGRVGRKRSKTRGSHMDRSLRLTAEQKYDITQSEMHDYYVEIDRLEDESEKVLETYKAILEEADVRLNELRKASYDFEREVMKSELNPTAVRISAEKVIRYFEDKVKGRDTLIEKLRLKNSSLKAQNKKLHLQLRQKEELGEVLHEVDFNQLKIENQQYIEKIDERNQDLLKLKLMNTSTLQVLNSYKNRQHIISRQSEKLLVEISSRKDLLSRIDVETEHVEYDRKKALEINNKFKIQANNYIVPDVLKYVEFTANRQELLSKVKSWERKTEIAEMELRSFRNGWNSLKHSALEEHVVY